jgi:transposase-like protein
MDATANQGLIADGSRNILTSAKRRRFTNCEKMALIRAVKRQVAAGESIRGACRSLNIIPKQYREWMQKLNVISRRHPQAKSIARGASSMLDPIRN